MIPLTAGPRAPTAWGPAGVYATVAMCTSTMDTERNSDSKRPPWIDLHWPVHGITRAAADTTTGVDVAAPTVRVEPQGSSNTEWKSSTDEPPIPSAGSLAQPRFWTAATSSPAPAQAA